MYFSGEPHDIYGLGFETTSEGTSTDATRNMQADDDFSLHSCSRSRLLFIN